ncbi:amidohydrolase [Vibrio profundum]|uniref:amidohydrolase n=1 Tax=Vibrio profundum TaxID=2910247 RepID=UPI003D0F4C8C
MHLPNHYYLTGVRLEQGFVYDGNTVIGTETKLFSVEIKDGNIIAIVPKSAPLLPEVPRLDANEQLMLPSFQDMHIHMEKGFYGSEWQAPRPRRGGILEMIEREQTLIPEYLKTSQQHSEQVINLLRSKGTTLARAHCNIDPVSGVKFLEHLLEVKERNQNEFNCEIVAFPQHGLLRSQVEPLVRDAMQLGANYVGGLDPTQIDGAMEKSLDTMFQISADYQRGIDIHLHESSPSGVAALKYILDTVERSPQLHGQVNISHGFSLATLNPYQLAPIAERMAELQVSLTSMIPFGGLIMPLRELSEKGVHVTTGSDCIMDHWSPFGSGDMLEKANLYAKLYRGSDEFNLSRSLAIATGGITPLDDKGQCVWPAVGFRANFVLIDASCSAESVARLPIQRATFYQGQQVHGQTLTESSTSNG